MEKEKGLTIGSQHHAPPLLFDPAGRSGGSAFWIPPQRGLSIARNTCGKGECRHKRPNTIWLSPSWEGLCNSTAVGEGHPSQRRLILMEIREGRPRNLLIGARTGGAIFQEGARFTPSSGGTLKLGVNWRRPGLPLKLGAEGDDSWIVGLGLCLYLPPDTGTRLGTLFRDTGTLCANVRGTEKENQKQLLLLRGVRTEVSRTLVVTKLKLTMKRFLENMHN